MNLKSLAFAAAALPMASAASSSSPALVSVLNQAALTLQEADSKKLNLPPGVLPPMNPKSVEFNLQPAPKKLSVK